MNRQSAHASTVPAKIWNGPEFSSWKYYLLALAFSLLSLPLYYQFFNPGDTPMIQVFLLPVLLSAFLGGLGPGLLATLVVGLLTDFYLLSPIHSWKISHPIDLARWATMVCLGVLISLLNESLHRARKRAEAEMQLNAVTLASIGDAVITTNHDGHVTFLNREAERMTGWTLAEAQGRPLDQVFHIINEHSRQPVESPVLKVLQTGAVVGLANHTVLIARDGREMVINDSGAPIKQADGRIVGVVLVFRDNTEQKQAEDNLRRQEEILEETGRIAEVGGWELDLPTGTVKWTTEVARIHELPPATPISREIALNFYQGDSRQKITAAVQAASERGEPFDLALEILTAKGTRKSVRTIGQPVRREGRILRLHGTLQDITRHKLAQEEILWKTALLEAQVDSSLDGILVVNEHNRRILQNRRLFQLFKVPDEIASNPDDSPLLQHVCRQAKHPRQFSERVAALYAHPDEIGRDEVELLDGTILDRYSAPVRGHEGQYYGRIWTFRDITDRRRLEEQFRQSQKMDAIGQLAGGVAHDFNNILAIVELQSELLKDTPGMTAEQAESVEEINVTVRRAEALTRQLLLFSRREVFQPRDLDLSQSISGTAKMLKRILGETIEMQLKLAQEPMLIHGDAGMMDQVLMNLAVNARDAMGSGGRLVVETAGTQFDDFAVSQSPQARPGAFVCLSVSDTGCGIPPENLQKIFDPFFTTKDIGKGTGLGLSTVFGIVQQHHGWINVYSELKQGTTFRIYLPRLDRNGQTASALPAGGRLPGGHETILVVEDDATLRASICKALSRLGYRLFEAPTGVQAIEVWRQHHEDIQLLLTDLVMPDGLNGKDLAEQLQKEAPRLKVIYMSGYSAEVVSRDSHLTENVNFLTKPFQSTKLAGIVRALLDQPR